MDRELVSWRREFVRNEASGGNRDLLDAMPHLVGNLLSVSRAKRRAGVRAPGRAVNGEPERSSGPILPLKDPSSLEISRDHIFVSYESRPFFGPVEIKTEGVLRWLLRRERKASPESGCAARHHPRRRFSTMCKR
jgi:hypothetical protein